MTASWKAFATVDPFAGMTGDSPGKLQNLVGGQWVDVAAYRNDSTDPMNGTSMDGMLAESFADESFRDLMVVKDSVADLLADL